MAPLLALLAFVTCSNGPNSPPSSEYPILRISWAYSP
ncbi:uncharacterized protein FFB20_01769 [Fusarium fujikuroi]|nr:uncharacterized protein FFB20_01769 [Fusarium fujikuroi]